MSIISLCAITLLGGMCAVIIRREHPVFSFCIALVCACMILINALISVSDITDKISSVIDNSGVNSEWLMILIKSLGISCLVRFGCDCCLDAGERKLCTALEISGKIAVIAICLPMITGVINTIILLVKV